MAPPQGEPPPPPEWIWDERYHDYRYYDTGSSSWIFRASTELNTTQISATGATTGPNNHNPQRHFEDSAENSSANQLHSSPSVVESSNSQTTSQLTPTLEQAPIDNGTTSGGIYAVQPQPNERGFGQTHTLNSTIAQHSLLRIGPEYHAASGGQPYRPVAANHWNPYQMGQNSVQYSPWAQHAPYLSSNTGAMSPPLTNGQPQTMRVQSSNPSQISYYANANHISHDASPAQNAYHAPPMQSSSQAPSTLGRTIDTSSRTTEIQNAPPMPSQREEGPDVDDVDTEVIAGTVGRVERLDPRFCVQPKGDHYFLVGQVFRVLWPEPVAERAASMTISAHEVSAQNLAESKRFGEKFFVKIRWFVVVKMRSNCCWCLPIQTYEGRGVTGDKQRSRHAIIYTGDTVPPLRPEEMTQRNRLPLGDAIRVVPDPHWEKLDPMSRINFDQVYTVQHNVKVRHFGKVHKNSERALVYQFMNACKSDSTAPRRDRPARTSSDYSTNQKSNTKIATDNDVNTRSSIFADHQATESQPSPHQPALNWGSVVGASRGTFGSNISSAPKELNAGSSTERAYQPAEGQLSPYQQPSVLGSTIKPPYALGGSTPASSSAYPSRPVYPQSLASSGAQEQAFQTHQTKRRGSEFEAAMGTSSQSNQQPRPRGNTRPAEQWQLNYPAQSGGSIEPEDTPMDDGNDPEASEASSTLALGNNVKDEQHSGKEPERPHRRQKQDTRVIGGEREHARRNEGGKRRNSEYGSQRWLG